MNFKRISNEFEKRELYGSIRVTYDALDRIDKIYFYNECETQFKIQKCVNGKGYFLSINNFGSSGVTRIKFPSMRQAIAFIGKSINSGAL